MLTLFCLGLVIGFLAFNFYSMMPLSQSAIDIMRYICFGFIVYFFVSSVMGAYNIIRYFTLWSVEIEPKYGRRFWLGAASLLASFATIGGTVLCIFLWTFSPTKCNQYNRNVQPLVEYCLQETKIPSSIKWEYFYLISWQDTFILGICTASESDLNAFLSPDKWKWEKPESKAQLEEFWKELSGDFDYPTRRKNKDFNKSYPRDFTDFTRYTLIQSDPRPGRHMQAIFVPLEEKNAAESENNRSSSCNSGEKRYRVWLCWFDT